MTNEYTDYTFEVIVRCDQNTGKVEVSITNGAGETVKIKGQWESRTLKEQVGKEILSDAWSQEYGNDKDAYEAK